MTNEGVISTAGSRATFPFRYPPPFFDIANTYTPVEVKGLFRFCRYYASMNPIVGAAIQKLSSYPITDIIIDSDDARLKKAWERLLLEQLKLKTFDREIGLDRNTFGNAFVTIHYPFIRHLVCLNCKDTPMPGEKPAVWQMSTADYEWDRRKFQIIAKCPRCFFHGVVGIFDQRVKDISRVRLVRHNPDDLFIDHNDATAEIDYHISPTRKLRELLRKGKKSTLEKTPWVFIEAVKHKTRIKIHEEMIYHFKRANISGVEMGWGLPIIYPVLKTLYAAQLLIKAREVIAQQHIVPLWVLFPQMPPGSNLDPFQHLDMGKWRSKVEDEIRLWRQDPNRVAIMPIPIGYQRIGGEGHDLALDQGVKNFNLDIIAGLMVPQEFIYGGGTFSGGGINVRMLENDFMNYRGEIRDFHKWVVKHLSRFANWKPVRIDMTDLTTADDVQKKEILMRLQQSQLIAASSLLEEYGMDYRAEVKKILEESEDMAQMQENNMVAQANAQGKAGMLTAKWQIRAQALMQKIQQQAINELAAQGYDPDELAMISEQMAQQGRPLLTGDQVFNIMSANRAMQGAPSLSGGKGVAGSNGNGKTAGAGDVSVGKTVGAWADSIQNMGKHDGLSYLSSIQKQSPEIFKAIQGELDARKGTTNMEPLPTQKPPRRAKGIV